MQTNRPKIVGLLPLALSNTLATRGSRVLAMAAGLACSATVLAQVPTMWSFRLAAIEGNAGNPPFNLPADAQLQSSDPAIDAAGNVAVRWTSAGSTNGIFLWTAADASGATIVTDGAGLGGGIALRNGRLAVPPGFAPATQEVRVFDYAGVLQNTYGLGGPAGVTGSFSRLRLDDAGRLAYRANTSTSNTLLLDQFVSGVRQTSVYATQTGPLSFIAAPSLSSGPSASMATRVNYASGQGPDGFTAAILRFPAPGAGGPSTPLVLRGIDGSASTYDQLANFAETNASGQVAYFARRRTGGIFELRRSAGAAGGTDVLIGEGNQVINNEVVIGNSEFANFGPTISDSGLVAWTPRRDGGNVVSESVWVGDGMGLHRVLIHGDTLEFQLGSEPTNLTIGAGTGTLTNPRETVTSNSISINAQNQIAMVIRLADGRDALVIASPLTPSPQPCGLSDVAGPNQTVGPDSALTADDIIVFLGWYFGGDARANVAGPNQSTIPDNVLTADDIIVFLSRYFAGC
ncbi:MAG: hypothetical protein MUE97_02325 [Phycisphaerales bacterium]|nr:hypothetical protein [Phycisphaerales bacterium]